MSRQELGSAVWYDGEGSGFAMLDVTNAIAPQHEQVVDGQLLMPKDEYHCTLVPVRKIVEDIDQENQLISIIQAALARKAVIFSGLSDERYVCEKEDEMTVIAPARLEGREELNQVVRQVVPGFKGVFAHVTLLKNENSPFGISVASLEALAARCRKV